MIKDGGETEQTWHIVRVSRIITIFSFALRQSEGVSAVTSGYSDIMCRPFIEDKLFLFVLSTIFCKEVKHFLFMVKLNIIIYL